MVQSEAVKNGGDQIAGKYRAFGGKAPDGIAFSNHAAPLYSTARKRNREALRPVVPPAGRVPPPSLNRKSGERGRSRLALLPDFPHVLFNPARPSG